jgi:hypothetical protein
MKAFVWALTGLFFGLWYTERQRRIEHAATITELSRKDRTLEELSDEYKHRREYLIDYNEDEIAEHLDTLCTQLVQPNMTPLEANRVGIALSEMMRSGLGWRSWRKDRMKRRADKWIDAIGEGDGSEGE